MTTHWRRPSLAATVVTAIAVLVTVLTGAVGAAAFAPSTDDEGGKPSLRQQLDIAARGYTTAKVKLDGSRRRQALLEKQLAQVEARLLRLGQTVSAMAAERYKTGQLSVIAPLFLENGTTRDFLRSAAVAEYLTGRDDDQLRKLTEAKAQARSRRDLLAKEVRVQETHLAAMAKQKRSAEKALAAVGGGTTTAGFSGSATNAGAAERNSDGSWPSEDYSANDPTTSGCITPRTLHALREAQLAGFKRHVSCHRSGGSGEHPKGRACDFASAVDGFAGTATGDERSYGNRLAAWLVKNVDRLGVLYVIWFHQIWMPGVGWSSYSGNGTPSGDHTNHVHLSMV